MVDDINRNGQILLNGHDPGRPIGKVLSAHLWISPRGTRFVSAVLGVHDATSLLSFKELNVDVPSAVEPPAPPVIHSRDRWINLCIDPRDVDANWLDDVLASTDLDVRINKASYNAISSQHELIIVGLLYIDLVRPFLKALATEAGKDAYASVHRFIAYLLRKCDQRTAPIIELQSHYAGCTFSFLFRGIDVHMHYKAHVLLSKAADQGLNLCNKMKDQGHTPTRIVYEYENDIWFPSYAELVSGKVVTDNKMLIALEQLPPGLSLGFAIEPKERDA